MSGIRGSGGGRPPPAPGDVGQKKPLDESTRSEPRQRGAQRADKTPPKRDQVDSFDRSGAKVNPQLENKLQALADKAGRVQFTNEELAYLANTFAAIVKQHPKASRLKRARLFTRAILKRRKLRKLFAGAREGELEEMYDVIAGQIEDSPHFAQLVEEVTEGARKLTAR